MEKYLLPTPALNKKIISRPNVIGLKSIKMDTFSTLEYVLAIEK